MLNTLFKFRYNILCYYLQFILIICKSCKCFGIRKLLLLFQVSGMYHKANRLRFVIHWVDVSANYYVDDFTTWHRAIASDAM